MVFFQFVRVVVPQTQPSLNARHRASCNGLPYITEIHEIHENQSSFYFTFLLAARLQVKEAVSVVHSPRRKLVALARCHERLCQGTRSMRQLCIVRPWTF